MNKELEQDLYYLRSVLNQLRDLRDSIEIGPSIGGEALADNIDWLDCYIERIKST